MQNAFGLKIVTQAKKMINVFNLVEKEKLK